MNYIAREVLEFVAENDVKFIKLAFCDLLGTQKNISITADALPRAFETGISFDASAVVGFAESETSDLVLFPDASTLNILPWRPQHGRVMRMMCDIKYPDGRPFERDGRYILKKAIERLDAHGVKCNIGTECEFYLFELDEKGEPTMKPQDQCGYCDVAPLDKGENVRRDICLTLEEMGILPERSHHEQGPGQNEIDFRYAQPLMAADNLITFKSVVKTMAQRNGLFASFMPKPLQNESGSGLHMNLSLERNGINIFNTSKFTHSEEAEFFIEGILGRIQEITAFLNPLTNSYRRLGAFQAPQYITWGHQNRSQLIRIPASDGEYSRMELRSPDPSCNPYIVSALLIHAGVDGIEARKPLRPAIDYNFYQAEAEKLASIEQLPKDLETAIGLTSQSDFVKRILPQSVFEQYITLKTQECEAINGENNLEKEHATYFYRI